MTPSSHFVRFTVPGDPQGKARPRLGRGGRTYTPDATMRYERAVAAAARAAVAGAIRNGLEVDRAGLWRVHITAFTARPASRPRDLVAGLWKSGRAVPRRTKPDADNILKAVLDALNGIVWHDDAQVVSATVERWMAPVGRLPGVDVLCEVLSLDGG